MSLQKKFIISLIIGIIHILPDLLFFLDCGKDFKGIAFSGTTDELFYLGRLNLLERGSGILNGHGLFEHINDTWSIHSPYKEMILFFPGKLLSLNNWQCDLLWTIVMPIFIFWTVYSLTLELSGSKKASVASGMTIIFGFNIFVFDGTFRLTDSYLIFMRTVSPQLPHLVLLLSLLLACQGMKTSTIWKSIASGILAGTLIYINIFYWIYFVFGFLMFSVLFFFTCKDSVYSIKKNILIIFLSFIITIPFWIHYVSILKIPSYQDVKFRMNIGNQTGSKIPILPFSQIAIFSYVLFCIRNKFTKQESIFLFSFPLAGLILLNQHLITKIKLPDIYIRNYLLKTFLLIAIFIVTVGIIKEILPKYQWLLKPVTKVVYFYCILLMLCGIFIQTNYFFNNKDDFFGYQKWGDVFRWLNRNTGPNDVVLTDPLDKTPIADFILAYTRNYVYLPRNVALFVSHDEYQRRYLLATKVFMHSEEEILSSIELCRIYGMATLKNYGGSIDCYKEGLKNVDVYNKLKINNMFEYKVNYIINNNPLLKNLIINSYPFVKIAYEANNIQVFKIISNDRISL